MYLYEFGIKNPDESGVMVGLKHARHITDVDFKIMVEKVIGQIKGTISKDDMQLLVKLLCDKFGFKMAFGNEIFDLNYATQYIYQITPLSSNG